MRSGGETDKQTPDHLQRRVGGGWGSICKGIKERGAKE